MAKKVKFKISEISFKFIEIETIDDEETIEEMNKDVEKTKSKNRRIRQKTISLDALFDEYEYEIPSNEMSILDKLILEERNNLIHQSLLCLTELQRKIIFEHFWKNKSLREIARERSVTVQSISENYHSALEKLREFLKKYDYFQK